MPVTARTSARKDVVFERFHNFVAFSQWGNTIFGIISRLSQDGGDPEIRAAFDKTMSGNPDAASGARYTPLEMFVMELFRTISPNGGSISAMSDTRQSGAGDNYGDSFSPFVRVGLPYERDGYIISPHTSTSFDPRHWTNPQQLDPGRYREVPTSAQVDEARSKQIGFAKCPIRPHDDEGQRRPQCGHGEQRSATTPGLRRSASVIAAAPASS
jgi:hypothetical protein